MQGTQNQCKWPSLSLDSTGILLGKDELVARNNGAEEERDEDRLSDCLVIMLKF